MSRYRSLTLRYPHLTEAEQAERAALALAGWHELLVHRQHEKCLESRYGPGEPCAACREELAGEEAEGLVTVGDLLKPDTWDDAHNEAA